MHTKISCRHISVQIIQEIEDMFNHSEFVFIGRRYPAPFVKFQWVFIEINLLENKKSQMLFIVTIIKSMNQRFFL